MDVAALPALFDLAALDAAAESLGYLLADAPAPGGDVQLAQASPPATVPPDRKVDVKPVDGDKGAAAAPGGAVDFSILGIVQRADIVGKVVIGLLVLASVWSWAIIIDKWLLMKRLSGRTDKFEDRFWSGGSVDELYDEFGKRPNNPMAAMFSAAVSEWRKSAAPDPAGGSVVRGVRDRIERLMQVTLGREMERLERYTSFLATVGSTAPFIGLFGTVWGIMNAFRDIAVQKNTNLATVAPGISEALFATALGLLAAIPAVVFYNKISAELDRYAHRLEGFGGEFGAFLSRQLDAQGVR